MKVAKFFYFMVTFGTFTYAVQFGTAVHLALFAVVLGTFYVAARRLA